MAFNSQDFDRKLAQWLKGRNGSDALARALCYLALILIIVDLVFHWMWPIWLSLVLLVLAWWRVMSKNVQARRQENDRFKQLIGSTASAWIESPVSMMTESRNYRHSRCPSCSQQIRVPRGKGTIRVTCPRCREKFTMKS
ncbi:MAG: hypothetical protein IJ125_06880 [Atopobiaceae bacterium]|nr:hypothetical protein [Atopobiaceae bacterium]